MEKDLSAVKSVCTSEQRSKLTVLQDGRMWASYSTAIFMQHCFLAALATLHLHCWFSSTQKCMLTVNLSIVPTYNTLVHITGMV